MFVEKVTERRRARRERRETQILTSFFYYLSSFHSFILLFSPSLSSFLNISAENLTNESTGEIQEVIDLLIDKAISQSTTSMPSSLSFLLFFSFLFFFFFLFFLFLYISLLIFFQQNISETNRLVPHIPDQCCYNIEINSKLTTLQFSTCFRGFCVHIEITKYVFFLFPPSLSLSLPPLLTLNLSLGRRAEGRGREVPFSPPPLRPSSYSPLILASSSLLLSFSLRLFSPLISLTEKHQISPRKSMFSPPTYISKASLPNSPKLISSPPTLLVSFLQFGMRFQHGNEYIYTLIKSYLLIICVQQRKMIKEKSRKKKQKEKRKKGDAENFDS